MTTVSEYVRTGNEGKTSIAKSKNLILQAEAKIEGLKRQVAVEERKRGKKGSTIGSILGATVGFAAIPITGGASAVFVPVIAGYLGKWIGKRRQSNDVKGTLQEILTVTLEVNKLKDSVAEAERIIEQLVIMEEKSHEAESARMYTDVEYRCLKAAEESKYSEVKEKLSEVSPNLLRIPGFSNEYEKISGRQVSMDEAVKSVIADLSSKVPEVQVLALKRLYPLEQESKIIRYSKEIYNNHLYSIYPQVQAAALIMMINVAELRPGEKEFIKTLERFLASDNNDLVEAVLFGIYHTSYRSGNINYQLKKISNRFSPYPQKLRDIAYDVLQKRFDEGTARRLNGIESTEHILQTIVGNERLERQLKKVIWEYEGSLSDISNEGPSLFLYLFGPPGIGKTTLISRLQEQINYDKYGLIRISIPQIRTLQNLLDLLKENSPLQGKTIFFDEFQGLDNIAPIEEQNRIIEIMKLIFATEKDEKGLSAFEVIRNDYGLNLQHTILAIATNIELSRMKCFESGTVGEALKARIEAVTSPLTMNPDLRTSISEFVEKFLPFKFYRFAANNQFAENIEISRKAQFRLAQDLAEETKDLKSVSGRDLTMKMVKMINITLSHYEEKTEIMLKRNADNKIIEPLTIDIGDHDDYIVLPISGYTDLKLVNTSFESSGDRDRKYDGNNKLYSRVNNIGHEDPHYSEKILEDHTSHHSGLVNATHHRTKVKASKEYEPTIVDRDKNNIEKKEEKESKINNATGTFADNVASVVNIATPFLTQAATAMSRLDGRNVKATGTNANVPSNIITVLNASNSYSKNNTNYVRNVKHDNHTGFVRGVKPSTNSNQNFDDTFYVNRVKPSTNSNQNFDDTFYVNDDVGLDSEDVGLDSEDVGLDSEDVGLDSEDVGLDSEDVGLDSEDVGLDSEDVGLDSEDVGLDSEVDFAIDTSS
jgi:GTPase SAR1 family protein